MSEESKSIKPSETKPSRRNFLRPVAAGAAAAAFLPQARLMAAPPIPSITIPKDLPTSLGENPKVASFEGRGMTGAEVFAKLCKEEDLAALFCCPGNYTVINAIAAAGVPAYGGRSEGSMCAMADGFSRVTGEVTACSGTEGPGFTNMIMNIAAANGARTPLLVLASNMELAGDDREKFIQTGYQQPTTTGMKKYGKRLIDANRVWEYGAYAFRNLKTGIPGPVHLDFPTEVARTRFTDAAKLTDYYTKDRYRTESRSQPTRKEVEQAMDMINKAERPIIVAGQGVFLRKAWEQLKVAAEKNEIAVVTSGPVGGHFPDDHRLSAGLAHDALMSADLVVFIGQYCMPGRTEYHFSPDAKTIRVHPVAEDIGRNWPIELGIVGDEKGFLDILASEIPSKKRDAWVAELAASRAKTEKRDLDHYELGLKHSAATNHIHPAVMAKEVHDLLYKGDIDPKLTVTGCGGWTTGIFTGRWLRANRPGQSVACGYQYGAIGPDMAMMVGASAAVQRGVGPQAAYKGAPALVVTSDAGIAYSMFELDTAAKYKIPLVAVVYNNNSWGMWPAAVGSPRSMHMYLFQENLRYDKMAEGLGARGEYVQTPEDLRAALKRSYQIAAKENISTLINVQALKDFTNGAAYAPGIALPVEPGAGSFAH
jgi:thiamine pyrophosphate-dependent acetolactate synthase large subunit-like protein